MAISLARPTKPHSPSEGAADIYLRCPEGDGTSFERPRHQVKGSECPNPLRSCDKDTDIQSDSTMAIPSSWWTNYTSGTRNADGVRVLINTPDLALGGGVSAYWRVVRRHLPNEIEYFTSGSRTERAGLAAQILRLVLDYGARNLGSSRKEVLGCFL